ncbi:MAG: HAMP domain-containing protein [Desulfuromonadales bacterium]|nr:HAMP domain-containing protein [Desulfuromonadales bacterium]
MLNKFRFPIRFKILLTLLVVITLVVSMITFIMANLFHADKTTYIKDLTSTIASNQAEKTRVLLEGYRKDLGLFSQLMLDRSIPSTSRNRLLQQSFVNFREFVAVTLYQPDRDPVTIFDAEALRSVGLDRSFLDQCQSAHPLPLAEIRSGQTHIINATCSTAFPLLMVAINFEEKNGSTIISGLIRLDRLTQFSRDTQGFEIFLISTAGVDLLSASADSFQQRIVTLPLNLVELDQKGGGGAVHEFASSGDEMIGGFSPVGLGSLVAVAQVPKSAVYLTTRELLSNMLYLSLVLLALAAIMSLVWSRLITRPLELLSKATRDVGQGRFDISIKPSSRDEIGELANSFNTMAMELDGRDQTIRQTQSALIQSEKMSAFGQLGAGIAHEVRNPLAGILGLTQLCLRKLDKESPLYSNLELIVKETRRCQMIMDNLLRFARKEEVAFDVINVTDVIQDIAAIVEHQLEINQVKLIREFETELPQIEGNANQLQQVLMNLTINAQQAMKGEPGTVTIRAARDNFGNVQIQVIDNGPGMSTSICSRVFDPFFSTKPSGEGTGLGLSVSYGIIEEHKGSIRVDSTPGEGTIFTITLPAHGTARH